MTGVATEGVWDRGHRGLTLGLLLTVSMTALEALAVATVLPAAVEDIGGLAAYGWVFSGFMLSNLIGITMGGQAADRRGPVQPFVVGGACFAIGLLVAGLAPSMLVLVGGRVAQGFGAGAISSVAYVAIGRGYASHLRPRMLALISSAWVVPGLIGPALAGGVADHVGWRWVFLGLLPPTAVAVSLSVPSLRRLAPIGGAESDRTLTSLRLAAGAGLLLFGIGSRSVLIATLLIGAGLALAVPAFRSLALDGTRRVHPSLPWAIGTLGLFSCAFFGAEAFLPLSLTQLRGQPATIAGLALTGATLSWTSGAWLQARLAAPPGRRRSLVTGGLLVMLLGIAGTTSVIVPGLSVLVPVVTWAVAGLGIGLAYATTTLVVLERAPQSSQGQASAALQLANVLGVALGAGVGGALVAIASPGGQPSRLGIAGVDLLMAVAAVFAIAAAQGLPARAPRQSENEARGAAPVVQAVAAPIPPP